MSAIRITCPNSHCCVQLEVPADSTGKSARCPKCGMVFLVPAAAPVATAVGKGNGADISAPVAGPSPAAAGTPTLCPSCQAPLLPGAISCMDCGYLLRPETGAAEEEGAPNLCANSACGVANPPGERFCKRCGQPLPLPVGTVLNSRYRLDKLIKMGGFGAVYQGTDLQTKREVAIKDMICADPQEFSLRLTFFRREAEILRSLQKVPVVPRFYDFLEQGQNARLVMEFIRGKDLASILEINGNKPFPLPLVIEWGKSICEVLHLMHNQSPPLIHRDLKPENIMLLEDGRSIKLIDFGTARDLGRSTRERLANKTKVYTEGYAAPEQIIGKPEPRSDLFSLAATLYQLATGKLPEGYHTARELEEQLKANALPGDRRWFYELLRINLAEDIHERYFTAEEFKHDLERRQVTREVVCAHCRTTNPVRTPYCSRCAEPLIQATTLCASCGKTNRLGCRFCIYCGSRLR
jgi:predicted Ser/Thr protein kinase